MLSNVVEDIFLVFISKMRSYSFIVVEWFTVCLLICDMLVLSVAGVYVYMHK